MRTATRHRSVRRVFFEALFFRGPSMSLFVDPKVAILLATHQTSATFARKKSSVALFFVVRVQGNSVSFRCFFLNIRSASL